jgi:hypothetical protein
MRAEGMARTAGRCEDCGATEDVRATHIVSVSMGGGYGQDNCRMRCKTCDKATDPSAR